MNHSRRWAKESGAAPSRGTATSGGGAAAAPTAGAPAAPSVASAATVASAAPRTASPRSAAAASSPSTRRARPATVGVSNTARTSSSTPSSSRTRDATWVASSEWPPRREEVVVDTHPGHAEQLLPGRRQALLDLAARRHVLGDGELRRRQRPAVQLAGRGERQLVEEHPRRGHHVGRQPLLSQPPRAAPGFVGSRAAAGSRVAAGSAAPAPAPASAASSPTT